MGKSQNNAFWIVQQFQKNLWFAIVTKPEVKFLADHPFQNVVDHFTRKVAEVDFVRFDLLLEIRTRLYQ